METGQPNQLGDADVPTPTEQNPSCSETRTIPDDAVFFEDKQRFHSTWPKLRPYN